MNAQGVLALALACVLAASRAHAQRAPRFELGVGTAVPLSAGVEGSVRVTDWLGVDLGVGMLPSPYVDLIDATVVAAGGYDDTTASLIEAALDKAVVARASIAIEPFRLPLAYLDDVYRSYVKAPVVGVSLRALLR